MPPPLVGWGEQPLPPPPPPPPPVQAAPSPPQQRPTGPAPTAAAPGLSGGGPAVAPGLRRKQQSPDSISTSGVMDGAGATGGGGGSTMRSSIAAAGLPIMAMPPRPAAGAAEEGEPAALSVAWRDEEKDEEQQQMEEGPAWLALDRSASPREFLTLEWRIAEARADAAASSSSRSRGQGSSSPLACLVPSSSGAPRWKQRTRPLPALGGGSGGPAYSSSASLAMLEDEDSSGGDSGAVAAAGAVAGGSSPSASAGVPSAAAAAAAAAAAPESGQGGSNKGHGGSRRGCRRPLLLSNIVGRSQSGDLTAVIGPSGAGKTTLLHCLSLRVRRFAGALRLNGKSPGPAYTVTAALVHQHEVLFGYMTVREHLMYHAAARMGPRRLKRPRAAGGTAEGGGGPTVEMVTVWESGESLRGRQRARVAEVLAEVGLVKAADTVIGGTPPLYNGKGISGGEKRRLAIATELLLCPSLLFLDEPTSGLDGVMADSVIASLKDLADHRGVLIMASVHCPSSDAARAFSHLLLLTPDGRQAYHGPMAEALPYFQSLGHRLPPACNPCDFFLELVSRTPPPPGASPLHSPIHQQQQQLQLQLQLFSSPSAGAHGGEEKDEELGGRLPLLILPFPAAMAAAATARRERLSSVGSRDGQEEGKENAMSSSMVVPPTGVPGSPAPSTSSSGTEEVNPAMVEATIREQPPINGRIKLLRAGDGAGAEGGSSTTTESGHSSSSQASSGGSSHGGDEGEQLHGGGVASASMRGGASDKRKHALPPSLLPLPGIRPWWRRRLLPSALLGRFFSHHHHHHHHQGGGSKLPSVPLPRCESWESGEGSVESVARPLALTPTRAAALIAVDALGAEEDEEEREEAAFRVHLDRLVACYQASSFCSAPPLPCELSHQRFSGVHRRGAGALTLLRLNLWRGWLQAKRNFIGCFGAMVAMLGAVGLLIGAIYAGQATKQGRDLIGMLFAASVTVLLNCAIAHMVRFPLEAGVVLREYLCGANAIGPYVAAKMVSDIPYTLAPIAFSFGLYWTAGLLPDWPTFWAFTGVLTLMSQAAMSLGVALACFSLDPAIGLTLLPLAAAPMILFSGVLYDQASIPRSLAWLSSFSIVNHGFELLLALQAPALPEGQAAPALAFVGVDPDPKSLRGHVAALGAILAASYVVTYLGLKVRSRFFPPAY